MHHIYHTEGIILGSKNFGEANKYYYLLTRDLGMIHATASGVRKLSSKLRFVLQDFSYVKVDLVQGANIWRVTSASKTNMLSLMRKNHETLAVFANIAHLLRRLLPGVEPNEALFRDLVNGLQVLEKFSDENAVYKVEDLPHVEAILVLRILHNLGYIGGEATVRSLVASPFEENLIFEAARSRSQVILEINKALRETQL